MPPVSPAQLRAARAFLGWSMVDLAAKARVSVSTVKRYEDGKGAPGSIDMMRNALADQGIRFVADSGTGVGLLYKPR